MANTVRTAPSVIDRRWGNTAGDGRLIPAAEGLPGTDRLRPGQLAAWMEHARLLDDWLADLTAAVKAGRLSTATRDQYRRLVRRWVIWLLRRRCVAPTVADVRRFLRWGPTQGWRGHTVMAYRSSLRALYRWAAQRGRHADITAGIASVRQPAPAVAVTLTPVQIEDLVASIAGNHLQAHRDRAMLALLHGGALETISLHHAKVRDFDRQHGTLRYRARGRRRADRQLVLSPVLRRRLKDYVERLPDAPGRPLFPVIARNRRTPQMRALSTLSMRLLVRRALDHLCSDNPTVAGAARSRQRAASRALRRSALAETADALGIERAIGLAGASRNQAARFARTLRATAPLRRRGVQKPVGP